MAATAQSLMQSLFADEGMRKLEEMVRPGILCAFDFDGTLAPIVARPDQAVLPDEIRSRLIALSGHTPVAVITGRSITDIRRRLGFEPAFVVGNHGLEGVPGWTRRADEYRAVCSTWRRQLISMVHEEGVLLEDKTYTLSVHYRLTQDPFAASKRLRQELTSLEPVPHIVEGKYVFNLLPSDAAGKGWAIERLLEACGAPGAVYVGDDVTDEDVFRLRRPDILSIRIEYAPGSAAEFFVPERGDIARVLDLIAEKMSADRRRATGGAHSNRDSAIQA